MNKNAGYTLIEVLIASVVLFMTLAAGAWAYTYFANQITFVAKGINQQTNNLQDSILARYLVESIMPYYVTNSVGLANPDLLVATPLFKGGNSGFVSVSSFSFSEPYSPSLIHVRFNEDDESIVVCSIEIENRFMTQSSEGDNFECTNSKQLIGKVSEARFSYYGWDTIEDYFLLRTNESLVQTKLKWNNNYNSQLSELMPLKVRIDIVDVENNKLNIIFPLSGRDDRKITYHRSAVNAN